MFLNILKDGSCLKHKRNLSLLNYVLQSIGLLYLKQGQWPLNFFNFFFHFWHELHVVAIYMALQQRARNVLETDDK